MPASCWTLTEGSNDVAEFPFMKWYARDFQSAAAHLTPIAELAYRRLLEFMWLRGGWLQLDHDMLSRLSRCEPKNWQRTWQQIEPFLIIKDGMVSQHRILADLAAAQSVSEARSRSGRAGAEAKFRNINKSDESSGTDANHESAPAHQKTKSRKINDDFQQTDKQTSGMAEGRRQKVEEGPSSGSKDPSEGLVAPAGATGQPQPANGHDEAMLDEAVSLWNATAKANGFPHVIMLTEPRRRALRLRLDEIGGIPNWRNLLTRIARNPFFSGDNKSGWKITFDWIMKPSNMLKTVEGNYDKKEGNAGRTATGRPRLI